MRNFFLFLVCSLFGSFQLLAQDKIGFEVKTTYYETGKTLDSALVQVYCDSVLVNSDTTELGRRVAFQLVAGKKYKIVVAATEKIARFFYVDLTVPAGYKKEDLALLSGDAIISLFQQKSGVDYSYVLSNPITTFSIDSRYRQLKYDQSQAMIMVKKVDELMK